MTVIPGSLIGAGTVSTLFDGNETVTFVEVAGA